MKNADAKYKICEIEVTRARNERKDRNGCERENVEGYLFPSGSEVVTLGNGSGIWKRLRWTSASHFPLHRFALLLLPFFFPCPCFLTYVNSSSQFESSAPNAALHCKLCHLITILT